MTETPKIASRAEQKAQTRGAILEAAIDLFSRRGFDGTTTTAIGKACGAQVPLIVYHYGSKEHLWQAAVGEIYRRVRADVDAGLAGIGEDAKPAERLRGAIRAQIGAVARNPAYMRLLLQEGTEDSDRLRWLVEHHQRRLSDESIELIRMAQQAGYLPEVDPMHAKYILSGAFSLAIALAPEYKVMTGENVVDEAFINRHVDVCFDLLFRTRPSP